MRKLKFHLIAAVVALSGIVAVPAPSWSLTDEDAASIRQTFSLSSAALHDVLVGIATYGEARAANNEYGMRRAAASMLGAMAEARIWLALLDGQVTAADFDAETDQAVTDLRQLLATTFDNLDGAFFSNDLQAINRGLDQSADSFNRLLLDLNRVSNGIVTKIGMGG